MMILIPDEDFYFEGGLMVMTALYHLKRGSCCGSGCRHCPYLPKHQAGSTTVETDATDGGEETELSAES